MANECLGQPTTQEKSEYERLLTEVKSLDWSGQLPASLPELRQLVSDLHLYRLAQGGDEEAITSLCF